MNTNDVKTWFQAAYQRGEERNGTIEYRGISFEADKPYILREPNQEYIDAEIRWYMSGNLDVDTLAQYYGKRVKIWDNVACEHGLINSNYGFLFLSMENYTQFNNVVDKLKRDKFSRQAVAIYNRPSMHNDSVYLGRADFVCTNAVQYFIVNDKLETVVQMRSNDAVFGYNNDYAWQRLTQEMVCAELDGIVPGKITWQVGSMHVYERHYNLLETK